MKKVWILLWICSWTSFLFGQENNGIQSVEFWFDTNFSERYQRVALGDEFITNVDIEEEIDVTALSEGMHFFNFRAKDSQGFWSSPVTKYFYHVGSVETNEIVSYEYWFDMNNEQKETGSYSSSFLLDVTSLSEGMHFLNVRFKDKRGLWSSPITHYFYHAGSVETNGMVAYEYWFDTDYAGKQSGKTSGSFIQDLAVSTLSEGMHYLNIRFQDKRGYWSSPISQYFYHNPSNESNRMMVYEYWVDEGGFEKRIKGVFTENQTLVSFDLDVEALAEGEHVLFFRAQDAKGQWSSPIAAEFRRTGEMIIPMDELNILKELYNSTGGANWKEQWNVTSTVADTEDWKGVSFDEEGHVVGVNVVNNNMEGALPASLFTLPRLKQICLDGNALTGKLNDLMSRTSTSLESVSLKQNLFTGHLPSLGSWTALTHLDVSYCHLESVDVLPENLVGNATVVPQYMTVPAVALRRSVKLELPKIIRFKNNSYDENYPNLHISDVVSDKETHYATLTYDAKSGSYLFSGSNELKIRSGVDLILESTVYANKSRSETFRISFDQGDVDASGVIDVADVVTTVNRVLGRSRSNETLFNFYAADTYKDDDINIQDIVKTTEIILDVPVEVKSVTSEGSGLKSDQSNTLFIENGRVILHTTTPIAGLDISLKGIAPAQVKSLVANAMFTIRPTEEGCRFILLTMGDEIPVGKTEIVALSSENVRIQTAVLVDLYAQQIPVTLRGSGSATGIEDIKDQKDFDGHSINIPNGATDLSVVIYHLTGQMVWKQTWNHPLSGSLDLTEYMQQIPSGGYILSYQMKVGNKIITRNHKLIIN